MSAELDDGEGDRGIEEEEEEEKKRRTPHTRGESR